MKLKIFKFFDSQSGQVSIFVALIFQVLFILFAMAINVGLMVHDKINLQNSIDLAAYYAATKQAEMLNAMAHQNYQIRQSWKLFAWRYRVLGTMGLERAPQTHPSRAGDLSETQYDMAVRPSVCVTYQPIWQEVGKSENLCNRTGLSIPPLPQVQVFAGFLGLNFQIAALSQRLRQQFEFACARHGAFNWWFAMSISHAFRLDQRNRRQLIYALANGLSGGSGGDFIDLNGDSVKDGALKTFLKNLTHENRVAFDKGGSFEILNSLEGTAPEVWLPKITISPAVAYVDIHYQNPSTSEGCQSVNSEIAQLPYRPDARNFLLAEPPEGLGAAPLVAWADALGMVLKDDYQFTLGVEKNPWVMAYMGAKAKVSPRQMFFPFGSNVELVARGFAKPFGGRMGPWHGSRWPRGAPMSTGPQTDVNLPERVDGKGIPDDPQDPRRLPNYSRFPGDTMGMISKLAQNSMKATMRAEDGHQPLRASYYYYQALRNDMTSTGINDIMAWDYQANTAPLMRDYEVAAIAPDLFDVTYYSIEPNYDQNYLSRIKANAARLNVSSLVLRPDLGYHGKEIPTFSIQEQIARVLSTGLWRNEAFYFLRDRAHLLTGWVNNETYGNFTLDDKKFGHCNRPDDNVSVKIPGSCLGRGGRVGYSVKLVSRDYLNSSLHPNGGASEPPGPIANPPSSFKEGW
ncbi:MAG: Tad domain-containing protein [Bdellovibrionales bacterium]|nr:Tad domain-containing protein [Bdellovibrionales bacterium]